MIFYDSCYSSECITVFLCVKKNVLRICFMCQRHAAEMELAGFRDEVFVVVLFISFSYRRVNISIFFFFFERGDFTINQLSRRIHVDDDDDGKTWRRRKKINFSFRRHLSKTWPRNIRLRANVSRTSYITTRVYSPGGLLSVWCTTLVRVTVTPQFAKNHSHDQLVPTPDKGILELNLSIPFAPERTFSLFFFYLFLSP